MSRWLETFEYRTTLDIYLFIYAGMAAVAIALLTISYESLRAANSDPAQVLKNE
jgi:putative ABC transport system permease protein